MRKCKENAEYRIIKKPHDSWGACYVAQKRKHFLWIWYWRTLSKYWRFHRYTCFSDIEYAKSLIEDYKSGEIVTEKSVVWYY